MLNTKKEVTKIFLTNRISATLIIPIELARKHGLNEPTHVVVEEIPEGILIRKLQFEEFEHRDRNSKHNVSEVEEGKATANPPPQPAKTQSSHY